MKNLSNSSTEQEIIIPSGKANRFSFLLFLIAGIIFGVPFAFVWGSYKLVYGFEEFFSNFLLLVPSLVVGMICHELIHAAAFSMLAGMSFSSIKFGINWRQLAPYVHVREAIRVKHYRIGILLPIILLGIAPAIASVIVGNGWLIWYSLIFTAGGAGDLLAWNALRKFNATQLVRDHPDHLGFTVQ